MRSSYSCFRLALDKAVSRYRRAGLPISVSAVPPDPGIDRPLQVFGCLLWSLRSQLGGLGRVFFLVVLALTMAVPHWLGTVWTLAHVLS